MIRFLGNILDLSDEMYHYDRMQKPAHHRQHDRALTILKARGMARLSEFKSAGITASTIARMRAKGQVTRLGRGIYQLADADIDTNHSLAQAAKRIPRGVICLTSALAFHELTDTMPSRIWIAIGPKDWRPAISDFPVRIVRFGPKSLNIGVKEHRIEGVAVKITTPAKTIVDLFRYSRRSGAGKGGKPPSLTIALEGLREALRQRKATPAEIARHAEAIGVWNSLRPYLEAMSAHG